MNLVSGDPALDPRMLQKDVHPAHFWKTRAKNALSGCLKYTGLMHLQEWLARRVASPHMSVLVLHRVDDSIPPDGLTIDTAWFRALCSLLQRHFHVVPLDEVVRVLKANETPRPHLVAITFDDCYRDNLFAARILAEFGFPATFFVPTQYVGTNHRFYWDDHLPALPNLSWEDVREMVRLGHDIGSHSHSHPDFGQITAEQAREELAESKKVLEIELARPVRHFAIPFGARNHFKPEFLPLVEETGYDSIVSAHGGAIFPGMAGRILPREPVPAFPGLLHFELHLRGCFNAWYGFKRRVGVIA